MFILSNLELNMIFCNANVLWTNLKSHVENITMQK